MQNKMGLVEDFLSGNINYTPQEQPEPEQPSYNIDGAMNREFRKDNQQGIKNINLDEIPEQQPMPKLGAKGKEQSPQITKDLKALNRTGLKPNVFRNEVVDMTTTKEKEPEQTIKTRRQTTEKTPYGEWVKDTPYGKVMEKLGLEPPKKPVDSERMRKVAGIQAIGEALRNVVDAVQGTKKAIIYPHKTYTAEFLKEAKAADQAHAKALEKWMKSMDDNSKNSMEAYLRYLKQEGDMNFQEIINKTGGNETTTKQGSKVSEGRQLVQPRGGYSRAGSGTGKKPTIIKLADTGEEYVLTDETAKTTLERIIQFKAYDPSWEQFIKQVRSGVIPATAKDLGLLIQHSADRFPQYARLFAKEWRVSQVTAPTTYNLSGKVSEQKKEEDKQGMINQGKRLSGAEADKNQSKKSTPSVDKGMDEWLKQNGGNVR